MWIPLLLSARGSHTCVCTCSLGAVRQKEVVLTGYTVYDAPAVCGTIQFCYRCTGMGSAPLGWLHCRDAVHCDTTGVPACCCVAHRAKEVVSRASIHISLISLPVAHHCSVTYICMYGVSWYLTSETSHTYLAFAVYWTLVVWPASPYLLPPHGKDIKP